MSVYIVKGWGVWPSGVGGWKSPRVEMIYCGFLWVTLVIYMSVYQILGGVSKTSGEKYATPRSARSIRATRVCHIRAIE